MPTPNSDAAKPDPRDLLREHIVQLEARAEEISGELAGVKAELKQYRTALAALEGKPAKQTVTREVVRGEVVAYLSDAPERTATRKDLEADLKGRLKANGYMLNGFSRRMDEVLGDESAFTAQPRNRFSLKEGAR